MYLRSETLKTMATITTVCTMKPLSQIKSDIHKNPNKPLPTGITNQTRELQPLKRQQVSTGPNKIRESQEYL